MTWTDPEATPEELVVLDLIAHDDLITPEMISAISADLGFQRRLVEPPAPKPPPTPKQPKRTKRSVDPGQKSFL